MIINLFTCDERPDIDAVDGADNAVVGGIVSGVNTNHSAQRRIPIGDVDEPFVRGVLQMILEPR